MRLGLEVFQYRQIYCPRFSVCRTANQVEKYNQHMSELQNQWYWLISLALFMNWLIRFKTNPSKSFSILSYLLHQALFETFYSIYCFSCSHASTVYLLEVPNPTSGVKSKSSHAKSPGTKLLFLRILSPPKNLPSWTQAAEEASNSPAGDFTCCAHHSALQASKSPPSHCPTVRPSSSVGRSHRLLFSS